MYHLFSSPRSKTTLQFRPPHNSQIISSYISLFICRRGALSVAHKTLAIRSVKKTNREYLAPHIRSMNNRFHSEAKLPWS